MADTATAQRRGSRVKERKPRVIVAKERTTISIRQDIDARIRDKVQKGENTYSGIVEAAVVKYLGADAQSTVA